MTRKREWIGTVLAAGLLSAPVRAAADPVCRPAARITGDPSLVQAVTAALHTRQSGRPVPECGAVDVQLSRQGETIRLSIRDEYGRQIDRLTDDPDSAATVVETFVRRDVFDPLLAARDAPPRPTAPTTIERRTDSAAAASSPSERARTISIAAGPALAVGSDGALWAGLRARGGVQVGAVCAGIAVQWARDSGQTGLSDELSTSRSELGFYATAELPWRWGRLQLAPGVGIGHATLDAVRVDEGSGGGEVADYQDAGLRLQAGAAAAYELGASWALRVDLTAEFAPFGTARIVENELNPDPDIAGVPTARGWLGASLVYGGL